MKTTFKLFVVTSLFSILTACGDSSPNVASDATTGANNSASASAQLVMSADAFTPTATAISKESSPMKARNLSAAPTPTSITLGAPVASQAAPARTDTDNMGKPLQIGFGRDVTQTSSAAATGQVLKWHDTPSGGKAAAISFTSTGAKGLRIGLLVMQLPKSATLRFYAKGAATAHEVAGTEVLSTLARNLAAGDTSDAGRTFWGPMVEGTESTVEIELPAGVSTDSVSIAIPNVSHFFMSLNKASEIAAQTTYSRANAGLVCEIDITCTSPLPAASNAVAHLNFMINGGSYICSGTLLNDSISSSTPYLLSANHCISNQTVASSLSTYWFYRSASCNATTGNYYLGTTSATLLYTAYSTDSTLLRLNSAAPAGALFAGWDATPPALNTALTNIHHPKGDAQRISSGSITSYLTRSSTSSTTFFDSNLADSTILGVTLTSGLTEGGSSGSGVFKNLNTNPQLIGQLFGGQTPSCANTTVSNVYGRFDYAYAAGMRDWLSPTLKPVYRFFNTRLGSHFFTSDGIERNNVIANLPEYTYEGIAFYSYPAETSSTGLSAVYRFYNRQTGAHFYTISTVERDTVINTLPQYSYEGQVWYARTASGNGAIPLYRFFHKVNGTHFYTASSVERDNIIAGLPVYSYEGIAYYVWPN